MAWLGKLQPVGSKECPWHISTLPCTAANLTQMRWMTHLTSNERLPIRRVQHTPSPFGGAGLENVRDQVHYHQICQHTQAAHACDTRHTQDMSPADDAHAAHGMSHSPFTLHMSLHLACTSACTAAHLQVSVFYTHWLALQPRGRG